MPSDFKGLRETILSHFPPNTHCLTLVADPDHLLHDEVLATALAHAGFRIIDAGDPVALRHAWYRAQPVTPEHPLIVVTNAAIKTLPYDLWQQGVVVDLALPRFFPHLDITLLAGCTLTQLSRIYWAQQVQPPAHSLTRSATLDYVLLHGFGATPAQLAAPGPLLRWLAEFHATGETLPATLCAALLPLLSRRPPLNTWPLAALLADRAAFHAFAQEQWHGYVRSITESAASYTTLIPFASDPATQAAVFALVSAGALTPVAVEESAPFPAWSTAAVRPDAAIGHLRRWNALIANIERLLSTGPATWEAWKAIASQWADLTVQRYAAAELPDPACANQYTALAARLAPLFAAWLPSGYPQLASRRVPVPHHLCHIPHVLAQRTASGQRVALIVLDGMSLAAWRTIWSVWTARHPTWRAGETLMLAQIPTITAISRQALLAGKPPRTFPDSLTNNQQESAHWRRFWEAHNLPANAVAYESISATLARPQPTALDSLHTRALAVVLPDIDSLVHGATEGLAGLYAGLRVWLDDTHAGIGSLWLETLIQTLLDHGYRVAITSDHGHVEAVGIGQPQEGVTVITRSKRARLYASERAARNVQSTFSNTTLWYDDGILPDACWVLMANGGEAFAPRGQRVVSHGGITLDETIVPFIEIEQVHG